MTPTKLLTCIVSFACIVGAGPASSAEIDRDKLVYVGRKMITTKVTPACLNYYKLQDVITMKGSGDSAAVDAFLEDKSNNCVGARKGIVGYVQQALDAPPGNRGTAAACLRPEGSTVCLWFDQFYLTAHY